MKAIMLEVPAAMLAERARLGIDRWDEVWEGVLHMVPPPSGHHQRVGSRLLRAFGNAADQRGLELWYETGLFDAADDYRVPDLMVSRPEQASDRGVDGTAELVVEILSPDDESRDKLAWYAARRVGEIVLVDPATRRVERYLGRDGEPVAAGGTATGERVELATLGAWLSTVTTEAGVLLRVDVGGLVTDI